MKKNYNNHFHKLERDSNNEMNKIYFKNWRLFRLDTTAIFILFLIPSSFLFLWTETAAEVSRDERVAESPRSNAPSPTPRERVENGAAGVNHEFAGMRFTLSIRPSARPFCISILTLFVSWLVLPFDPSFLPLLRLSLFSSPFHFRLSLLYTHVFFVGISFREGWRIIVWYFFFLPIASINSVSPLILHENIFKCIVIFHLLSSWDIVLFN